MRAANYTFFSFILMLISVLAYSGNDKNQVGARSQALAFTGLASNNIEALFNNAAGLALLKGFSGQVSAENHFLLSDINSFGLGLGLPVKKTGSFGLGVTYYGNPAYNETRAVLAYGRRLFKNFSIGVQLQGYAVNMGEYGSTFKPNFGLGILYKASSKMWLAGHLHNPLEQSITGAQVDNLPTILQVGMLFNATDALSFFAEIEKNLVEKPIFKVAVEYAIAKKFFVRGGISGYPAQASLGAGVQVGNHIFIDFGSAWHQTLGYSPAFTLRFQK
ncbi:MAG: hypothetical protein IPI59_13890 [Sphingobacteriales bacterium]|jgi:hypothetical protein|nr:hypothetical protein [Sphingobacteriales bacterium]MBP9141311.1 hypothetical protein [Chitinophagales bacterium]MDA0197802.1 hypothetical protein [Bacteroidota bacterium]MBK6888891.1 hypothetical protein [Sphingobacteriales bacterium]MBK7528605.1 hypothetical protein [Sphingobacteriales bacterium]